MRHYNSRGHDAIGRLQEGLDEVKEVVLASVEKVRPAATAAAAANAAAAAVDSRAPVWKAHFGRPRLLAAGCARCWSAANALICWWTKAAT